MMASLWIVGMFSNQVLMHLAMGHNLVHTSIISLPSVSAARVCPLAPQHSPRFLFLQCQAIDVSRPQEPEVARQLENS